MAELIVTNANGDAVNVDVSIGNQITMVVDKGIAGPTGAGVAIGGTTGQVLTKASDSNYDTTWADTTGTGNVVLNTRPTLSVTGADFTLQDATDNTKKANFVLSGITTGLNVNYTLPQPPSNGTSSTLVDLQSTQSISGAKTFTGLNQNIGSSTGATTTNIAYGATASGVTKTVNIGTSGLAGSTTNITIGSTTGTSTTTFNGITKSQTYLVANLPSASTSGVGARAFVTNALAPTFGATVVTGGAVATPVYSDGTNWKVG